MRITQHLAFPSPGASGHHSSTDAINLLQSDLLNFMGPFGIHKRTPNPPEFLNSPWELFSFLICWLRDWAYSAISKGLSGNHKGKRFPCGQSWAMQKE